MEIIGHYMQVALDLALLCAGSLGSVGTAGTSLVRISAAQSVVVDGHGGINDPSACY